MSADRSPYICQSQSLNIFLDDSSPNKVSNMLIYGWKAGLKTGLYYLRTESSSKAENVSQKVEREKLDDIINPNSIKFSNGSEEQQDECIACEG